MSRFTEIAAKRKAAGKCPTCGARKPKRGRVSCSVCIRRAGERRQLLVDIGLCVDCRTPTGGTRRCGFCQQVHHAAKQERRRVA